MAQRPPDGRSLKHHTEIAFYSVTRDFEANLKRTAITENGRKPQSIKQHTIVKQIGIALFLKTSSETLTTQIERKVEVEMNENENLI
jgi:hypothetical protein